MRKLAGSVKTGRGVRSEGGVLKWGQVVFSGHAIQRMFQRNVEKDDVIAVINEGEIIGEYR